MERFCGKCGGELNAEGMCPKCDCSVEESKPKTYFKPAGSLDEVAEPEKPMPEKPMPEKPMPEKPMPEKPALEKPVAAKPMYANPTPAPEKRKNVKGNLKDIKKKAKLTLIITIIVLSVYTVGLTTLSVLVYLDVVNVPYINDIFIHFGWKEEKLEELPIVEKEDEKKQDNAGKDSDTTDTQAPLKPFEVTRTDADAFYEENGTIVSSIRANDSTEVHSESEVTDIFKERGFNQEQIITNYSMDGEYSENRGISGYSSTRHPVYYTLYETPSGDLWRVFEINGVIMADPLSFNQNAKTPVTVSETDTVACYDSTLNKFYVTKPDASMLSVKTVAIIDAETLNNITDEELGR